MALQPLPVDAILPDALARLRAKRRLVLTAEPGAGKTTRLAPFLVDHGNFPGQMLVLLPRRLAARLSAERVASERNVRVGEEIGFITKLERRVSRASSLVFITEGVLTRRLVRDRTLEGVSVVILDEFHERSISTDLALALLLELQRTSRPDLHLVIMSATIDAAELSRTLDCPHVHCEGRTFPVAIEHRDPPKDKPLESHVASALFDVVTGPGPLRDVLVFLPGMREIRRAIAQCERLAEKHDLALLPLHGSLAPHEQDLALRSNARTKVIFSTNVAETSLTIPGVGVVIDSGFANVATHSPWSGLPVLGCEEVSQASAIQRAGRAGRTEAGRAIRLYTEAAQKRRPLVGVPEIARADLADPLLLLLACGVTDPAALPWYEAPDVKRLGVAWSLLARLGAVDPTTRHLTEIGARMATQPFHPRLARAVLEGERRGVREELVAFANALSERWEPRFDGGRAASIRSDAFEVRGISGGPANKPWEDAVLFSILTGFVDRVGRLRSHPVQKTREVVFAEGGSASVSDASRVRTGDLVVAFSAREHARKTIVDGLSEIESDWLIEVDVERMVEESTLEIGDGIGRVFETRTLRFGKLPLTTEKSASTHTEANAAILAEAILAEGLPVEVEARLQGLEIRLALLREHRAVGGTISRREIVTDAARAVGSLSELRKVDFAELFVSTLPSDLQRDLAREVPARLALAHGRSAPIEYSASKSPTVAARLQEFFGLANAPAILGGKVPLVLELLAPNLRAVQVTTDLAGFWKNHYPAVAKELRRKYPKHSWPDDPLHADPPAPRPRRDRG